jgi:hypothetical protein
MNQLNALSNRVEYYAPEQTKPARCQPITVTGFTIAKAFTIRGTSRYPSKMLAFTPIPGHMGNVG